MGLLDILKTLSSFLPKQTPSGPTMLGADFRSWRLTKYYVADEKDSSGAGIVPVFNVGGRELARVSPSFFAQMSLEGTGLVRDGRLLNVAGPYVDVRAEDYGTVLQYHTRYLPTRPPGYSGIMVSQNEPRRVIRALAYREVPPNEIGEGYGLANGKPMAPFRTVAADIGRLQKHEPRWKGQGGICPIGTRVFIQDFVGRSFPDGRGGSFVHDGWLTVNDTGGGIFGKHFDIFCGTTTMAKQAIIPDITKIWYDGIALRVPSDYKYGLVG